MARNRGQRVTYISERCVLSLDADGLTVREIAPGVDVQRDVVAQSDVPLRVAPDLRPMDPALFRAEPMHLKLPETPRG
jgi:acyl CoA:acetate/3-ketoacid CoA transferase